MNRCRECVTSTAREARRAFSEVSASDLSSQELRPHTKQTMAVPLAAYTVQKLETSNTSALVCASLARGVARSPQRGKRNFG